MSGKRIGTIQVDLDGLWTNLKYYGYETETSPDLIFESSVPRFLDLFDKYGVKATFFLVGKDIEVKEKAELIRKIDKAGHEIANHTYSHPFGFRKLSSVEKVREIGQGEEAIKKVVGKKPAGFKAPGYDVDPETLQILASKNYLYDSSMIPTFVYPLIMKINRLVSGGVKRNHGPKFSWFLAPNNIYQPSLRSERRKGVLPLTELPCTVIPFLRLPFHATFVSKLGFSYFNLGYRISRASKVHFNYEFHAVDLADEDKRLPSVGLSLDKRINLFRKVLKKTTKDYQIITSEDFVKKIKEKY